MQVRPVNSWDAFVAQIEELHAYRDAHATAAAASVSELLYRGQPNACMDLKTTLERATPREVSLTQYYRFVSLIKAKIESVTGKTWAIPSIEEVASWSDRQYAPFPNLPGYPLFAYVRHHGLPSPLLDLSGV